MKFKLHDGNAIDLPTERAAAVNYLADLMVNQGNNTEDAVDLVWEDVYQHIRPTQDAVASSEIRPLLQSAMEVVIREPLDPIMSITPLFDTVMAKGLTTQVLAGAMGTVTAADIPEHGTYPEVMFQIGGGLQTAWIGKSGLAVSFTDEALRYSTWDIMALNLREMGRALTRHKEQKAIAFLRSLGTELFNNATPATSLFGVTTGRDLSMQPNATLTMDDLFKGMAHLTEEGFQPTVLLMNPLFFYMYIQDPVLRNMMIAHGGGAFFNRWSGNPGPLDPWSNGSMGAMGPSRGNRITPVGQTGATGVAGREHGMTAAPPIPSGYFPWPLSIVTSPFVPFDRATGLGDIYLISQGNVGMHLVDEERTQVEWRDESVEVVKAKLRERYGFAVTHEGQAVGVFKNVKLDRNYWDQTVSAVTHDVSGEVDAWTALA